jgi:hypothetical protein
VAHYLIDADASRVSVVARPRLSDGPGAVVRAIDGAVELADGSVAHGALTITLEGDPPPSATLDLGALPAMVTSGPGGETVLEGRTDRPAGAFGLAGPPLLNPTLQLRWRLVLVPV